MWKKRKIKQFLMKIKTQSKKLSDKDLKILNIKE